MLIISVGMISDRYFQSKCERRSIHISGCYIYYMSHGLSWRPSLSFVLILSSEHTGFGRQESSFLPQRDCKFIAYYLIQFGEGEKSIPPVPIPALLLSLVDPGNDWG